MDINDTLDNISVCLANLDRNNKDLQSYIVAATMYNGNEVYIDASGANIDIIKIINSVIHLLAHTSGKTDDDIIDMINDLRPKYSSMEEV